MVEDSRGATKRRVGLTLGALLGVGLAYRLITWWVWPVAHDEITVMSYGLWLAGRVSGGDGLWFEVPASISNGITPLWWWLQAIPGAVFPPLGKFALRSLPLLLGLVTVALAFRAGRHVGGLRTGWLAGFLAATSSLVLYMNGRGEFTESLIVPCVLALVVDLDPRGRDAVIPWRAALWPAICLLVYLGKGLPIWFMYSGCLGLLWLFGRLGRTPAARLGIGRLAGLVLLPLAPSVLWLFFAQATLFGPGAMVITDIGPIDSMWHSVRVFTFGYGTEVKEFMVAGWREAVFPFTYFQVWPGLCLLALPIPFALGRLVLRFARAYRARDPEGSARALVPICLSVPFLVVVLAKGAMGARFHLLYLVALLPAIAALLDAWVRSLEARRGLVFLGGGALTWIYTAWTWSWSDRLAGEIDTGKLALTAGIGLVVLGALTAAGFRGPSRRHAGTAALITLCAFFAVAPLVAGPVHWGQEIAWEPGPFVDHPPHPVAAFRNPQLSLANYALRRARSVGVYRDEPADDDREAHLRIEREAVRSIRPLLRDCLTADPDDRYAILFAAPLLFQVVPSDRAFVLRTWKDYVRRHPEDREVAAIFARRR